MSTTLYHFAPSPPSRCVLNVIRVLNIDVKLKHVNVFKNEQLNPEFIAINPQHCIPTLDDNGFILWESHALSIYLATKYDTSGKLYPRDNPEETALINRLLFFDDGSMFPCIRAIVFPTLFLGEKQIPKIKRDRLNKAIQHLNEVLEGNKWLAHGTDYTIADISLMSAILGISIAGWDLTPFPNVQKWLKDCSSIPGYAENKEGATEFANALKSKLDPDEI